MSAVDRNFVDVVDRQSLAVEQQWIHGDNHSCGADEGNRRNNLLSNYEVGGSARLRKKLEGTGRSLAWLSAEQNELRCVASAVNKVWKVNPGGRSGHTFVSRWSGGNQQIAAFIISSPNAGHGYRRKAGQPQHSSKRCNERFDSRYLIQEQRSLSVCRNSNRADEAG